MESLIENLYVAFGKYPLKERIDGCPCCNLGRAEKGLHSKELRELGWDELGLYTFKAMTTFGDVADFKHFLPRICELYVEDIFAATYDVGILFSKLEYADWRDWPDHEHAAVAALLKGWLASLARSPDPCDAEILREIRTQHDDL